ncbi:hypothetical protein FOXG_07126 [Fusarium oxysporum f. sp. lycopersici 4287]|uniref:Nephrocystin 3-like N-terminal domain-containing protein n=2 Tax=Fusarium oxysporum TaxID=5507 RepID=A0A0J9V589_FUSO4|nr:hypothetical protein FOXG_07126 [Fusarium oxysporum f. sp. lycopersici 4287]KAJ9419510.1 hypothetical protein QL093DRAFT_2565569 [Fusarium oxysporum]KNB06405.1 hypothetical protein FOXG_07126 [Fusarium oxysporum f. sp. lycopersici 4287]
MPELRRHISEAIAKQEDIMEHSLIDQWKQLIIDPLSKISAHLNEAPILLVIDTLDEWDNGNDIRTIIKVLAAAGTLEDLRLRILITSRSETTIRHGFNQMPEGEREVFVLEDISPDVTNRDLCFYFVDRLRTCREERELDYDDWPGSRRISRLVENASGLFIWASTACRFICEARKFSTIRKRMEMLIHGFSSGDGLEKKFD